MSLTGDLEMANASVMSLTGDLETANASVMSLTGDLETANASVMSLTGELGTANADVTRLTGELGTANASVMSLTGDLETANGMVASLTTEVEGDGTDANPGLRAQLAAANARIAELQDGTASDVLAPIKTAASDAATAAGEASTAAGTAADEAATAAVNRQQSIQTGDANSAMDADMARSQANTAAEEAMKAATASQMAQDAADAATATPHKNAAEAAQKAAEDAQTAAETARDDAMDAAMVELRIDGKDKSVGMSSLNADDANNSVTINDKTTEVGRLKSMDPKTMGGPNEGREEVAKTEAVDYVAPKAGAFAREVTLGRVIDSSDDMARLMLITHYAGTNTVRVYGLAGGDDPVSHKKNTIRLADGTDGEAGTNDDVLAVLRSVGTFYLAGADSNGLDVQAGLTGTPQTPEGDSIAADGKSAKVYSYVDTEATDDPTRYVVLKSTLDDDDGTTYTYSLVDVHISIDMDGDNTADDVYVTADLPAQTAYKHIHFGVWAGLGDPEDDGSQEPGDLGIAFVQSIGDGMTGADMPNNGVGNFTGNWVAAIQAADDDGDGDIVLKSGDATLSANFSKDEIEATLTDLATLTGSISGSTFTGTKASDVSAKHGLDADGDFDGEFNGVFYGSKAAEAGGIFDFMSEGMEEGAFRGAFGADRDPESE
jgi:hypothetical protein